LCEPFNVTFKPSKDFAFLMGLFICNDLDGDPRDIEGWAVATITNAAWLDAWRTLTSGRVR
jgi:hypothetical protein